MNQECEAKQQPVAHQIIGSKLQQSIEPAVRLLPWMRYIFVAMGATFLLFQLAEQFWLGEVTLYWEGLEVLVISLLGPALVWAVSRWTESLARQASRTYTEKIALMKLAQDEVEVRMQAQEDLERSEVHFRSLTENALDIVTVVDEEGLIVYESPSVERVLGFKPEELVGKNAFDLVHEADLPIVLETFARVLQNPGAPEAVEYRFQHKDGSWHVLEAIGQVPVGAPEIGGVVVNSRDITDRKRAQEAERHRTQELEALLNIASILARPGGFEEKCAHALEQMSQVSQVDWAVLRQPNVETETLTLVASAGPAIDQVPPRNDIRFADGAAGAAFREGEMVIVNDYAAYPQAIPADKAKGINSLVAIPIKTENHVLGVINLVSYQGDYFTPERVRLLKAIGDGIGSLLENARLSEEIGNELQRRHQAETALREGEARFRELYEEAPVGYHDMDADGLITQVNRTELEMLGYTAEEMLGRPLYGFTPDPKSTRREIEDRIAGHSERAQSYEQTFIRKDGSVFPALVEVRTLRDETGRNVGLRCTLQDITERKHTEEQIRETGRLASIGELAAGVAHEVNNPLTSVLGFSQLLLRRDLPDAIRSDLQEIYSEAQRAAKVVQNLLSFARKHEPEKQYSDVVSILNRALELKHYDFKTSNIRVSCQLTEDLPWTMVDEHQLIQVFLNILTNAEQSMAASDEPREITIQTTCAKEQIRISIIDNGSGIPPQYVSKIFDPFFTTKDVGEGTGLGLSICYGIAKQHGGELWAESELGEGATFHLTLPVLGPGDESAAEVPAPKQLPSQPRRILVVDDEPAIQRLLSASLSLKGLTVDLADDGEDAWRKLQESSYDCILLDLKMPGMGGKELYGLIKELDEGLARKVIFVTGDTVSCHSKEFIAACGNPAVSKPFSLEQLYNQILTTLEETNVE